MFAEFYQYLNKVLFLVGSEKRKLKWLLPLYLLSSVIDLFGIGLLVVLISMLKDTDAVGAFVSATPVINAYADSINLLLIALSAIVLLTYVVKTVVAFYANKFTLELSFMYGAKLRAFLMGIYQRQTYANYIRRNSSEYIYNVQTMAGRMVSYSVQPLLRIIGDGLVALLIIIYLAIEDPFVLAFLLILVSIGGLMYDRAFRNKMATYGAKENNISSDMIRHITEGMHGYKESRIFGIANFFYQAVANSANNLANARVRSQLITTSVRFILELIIVFSVVLIIISALVMGRDQDELLTTLALFLVASLRLLPAMNQIITSITRLRYGKHAVDVLYKDVTELSSGAEVDLDKKFEEQKLDSISANDEDFQGLQLQDVSFRYSTDAPWVLDSIDLSVKRYDIVGIVGPSGSGKSTMIALMLGLLSPEKGKITFNNNDLSNPHHVYSWHKKVSYLPQEIFLTDDTVAQNVALGISRNEIDTVQLKYSLEKAQLDQMIEKMPDGIDSSVGEKGSRISGGQRQRVALARAFYYDSEVLIMDESTSALDTETTQEIISELQQLKGKVTIVVITHQKELLSLCDKVFHLKSGHLTEKLS